MFGEGVLSIFHGITISYPGRGVGSIDSTMPLVVLVMTFVSLYANP